jgi:hypothetical protein
METVDCLLAQRRLALNDLPGRSLSTTTSRTRRSRSIPSCGGVLTVKAAQVYAVGAIADPGAREAFIERTRLAIRATLHAGKDVPAPVLKDRGKELER